MCLSLIFLKELLKLMPLCYGMFAKYKMFFKSNTNFGEKTLHIFNLNFGPQHPSAHGVLRLVLEMLGEQINKAIPHIGLLHRGTEKLLEHKNFIKGLPYFDRLDYVSMMAQEHGYCIIIEKLLNLTITTRAQNIRVIFLEITRILNHLMAITTHAMDVGALTPFLWAFEEREKLMELYERVSGARMHAAFFRPGGVSKDIPKNLLNDIYTFCGLFNSRINELEELLTKNRIWTARLINIGFVDKKRALSFAFSGVISRGSGIPTDLRKKTPYESYSLIKFESPLGKKGDCFDRYNLRIIEMRESLKIIYFAISKITTGSIKTNDYRYSPVPKHIIKNNMEALIMHFKYYAEAFTIISSEMYIGVEAPKGEFGVFLGTNNTNKPQRCKIKSSGFLHLQGANYMAQKHLLADIVTIIGTQDIVFGEVDR
jgi:NADH dehydrogenase (ubiquinone) Fe-S protein 2